MPLKKKERAMCKIAYQIYDFFKKVQFYFDSKWTPNTVSKKKKKNRTWLIFKIIKKRESLRPSYQHDLKKMTDANHNSKWQDLNLRSSVPKTDTLPDYATLCSNFPVVYLLVKLSNYVILVDKEKKREPQRSPLASYARPCGPK